MRFIAKDLSNNKIAIDPYFKADGYFLHINLNYYATIFLTSLNEVRPLEDPYGDHLHYHPP